jgi:hypothetical protein
MKKILFFAAACLYAFVSCYSQDTSLLARTPYKLSLVVDQSSVYDVDLPAAPFVGPKNTIQIYPGEKVFIEIDQQDGVIEKMTAVKENSHPEKTITISFKQVVKKKVCESTMLSVENPFPYKLVYGAMILSLKGKWVETDVYPVEAGLSGYEVWPYVVVSVGLAKWKFENIHAKN